MYINCHSYYSLRYGTLYIEDLVAQAKQFGIDSLVLTDINSSQGMMDFIKECNENDIQPIAGIEFRKNGQLLYIGIAKNNGGFTELNEFLTGHNLSKTELPENPPEFKQVYVVFPFGKKSVKQLKANEFIGIKPQHIPLLITSELKNFQDKLLVHYPITLKEPGDYETHKCLRAVDENVLISQLRKDSMASPDESFVSTENISNLYGNYPQILANTQNLLKNCRVGIDFKKTQKQTMLQ